MNCRLIGSSKKGIDMKKKWVKAAIALCFATVLMFSISLFASAEEEPTTSIGGHSLSLSTNMEIVYFANFQNVPDGAECGVVYSDTPTVDYSSRKLTAMNETITNNGLVYYKYKLSLAAKELSKDCYAKSYIKVGDTVYYGALDKYSVVQYAYNKRNETDPGSHMISLKQLVDDVLDYGAAAQLYLGYNTDRLANETFYQVVTVNATLSDGTSKGMYLQGDELILTAKNQAATDVSPCGYFDHWENGSGQNIGTTNPMTITVGAFDETYTAVLTEGHNIVVDPAVPATCTDSGLTEGSHCSICGETIVAQQIIPAHHNPSAETSYDSSSHFKTCTVCGAHLEPEAHSFSNGICTHCGYEENTTAGLAYSLNSDEQSYTVTGLGSVESVSNIVIPSIYKGLPVTAIGESAFQESKLVESITISDSIGTIGNAAFKDCANLTEVSGGNALTIIGEEAFYNCSALTEFIVPGSCTTIGAKSFYNIYNSPLTITINPDALTYIGKNAFYNSTIIWNSDDSTDWKIRFDYPSSIRFWAYNGLEYYESSSFSNITVYATKSINRNNANELYHSTPNYSKITESTNSNAVGLLIRGAQLWTGTWIKLN